MPPPWVPGASGSGATARAATSRPCWRASERGRVAFQLLIYPVTDLSREHPSYATFAEAPFLTAREMRWLRDLYLTREEDARDPRASPLLGR